MKEIQKKINKLLRSISHIKREELADRLDVSPRTIYRWFSGDNTPTLYHIIKIELLCKEDGIEIDAILPFNKNILLRTNNVLYLISPIKF